MFHIYTYEKCTALFAKICADLDLPGPYGINKVQQNNQNFVDDIC